MMRVVARRQAIGRDGPRIEAAFRSLFYRAEPPAQPAAPSLLPDGELQRTADPAAEDEVSRCRPPRG